MMSRLGSYHPNVLSRTFSKYGIYSHKNQVIWPGTDNINEYHDI